MPINKWLTEKANEDARYRVLKGIQRFMSLVATTNPLLLGVVFGTNLENLPLSEKGESYLSSVPSFVADVLAYLEAAGEY